MEKLSREIKCLIFQVFGTIRPDIEARPTAFEASILPLGHGRECVVENMNNPHAVEIIFQEINSDPSKKC